MNRDVVILQVTQVSSGILRRLKVRRSIWDSQARTLVIMAPLQGQLMLPFRTVLDT